MLLLIKGNVHFEIRDPYPSEAMVFWQKLEYIKIYVIDPINRNLIFAVPSRLQNIWWQKCVFHRVINSVIAKQSNCKKWINLFWYLKLNIFIRRRMNSSIHAYTYGGSFLLYFWESTTETKLVMMSLLPSCHILDLLNKEYIFFRKCWNSLPYSCDCLGSQAFRMRVYWCSNHTHA